MTYLQPSLRVAAVASALIQVIKNQPVSDGGGTNSHSLMSASLEK